MCELMIVCFGIVGNAPEIRRRLRTTENAEINTERVYE